MPRRVALATLAVAVFAVGVAGPRALVASIVDGLIALHFDDVPSIDTAALAALIEAHEPPVLLDARTREEYAAGHLAGAIFLGDVTDLAVLRDRDVVVYCSVGYRSALATRALRAQGITRARNLRGSLFRWVNEARPLARSDGGVGCAHRYTAAWGILVTPARRCPR